MSKRALLTVILAFLALAGAVPAQYRSSKPERPHVELFPHAGFYTEYDYDEWATEFAYGGAVAVYVTRDLAFEFDFEYADGFEKDIWTAIPGAGMGFARQAHTDYWTEINVLYHFGGDETVRPYISGGLGNVHSEFREDYPEYPGIQYTSTYNEFTGNFGGGVKILIAKNVAVRLEYKLSGVDGVYINRFRGGVSFIF